MAALHGDAAVPRAPARRIGRTDRVDAGGGMGMGELSGQVALVTGGGRGIGRAVAQAFASAGAQVAVTARSADQLDETVALIHAAAGTAVAVPADVSDPAAVVRMVAET